MSKKWPEVKNFYPTNPEKYIGDLTNIKMRSSWEIKFAKYCDTNPSVLKWNSEDIRIPYWSTLENKQRTYHLDFIVTMVTVDGPRTYLIEIKPYNQTIKPEMKRGKKQQTYLTECQTYQLNIDKWRAANEWAKSYGYTFIVLTEEQLYGKNIKKKK